MSGRLDVAYKAMIDARKKHFPLLVIAAKGAVAVLKDNNQHETALALERVLFDIEAPNLVMEELLTTMTPGEVADFLFRMMLPPHMQQSINKER